MLASGKLHCVYFTSVNQSVSAIVAAYNEYATLKPIIKILTDHERIGEVVIVDDGSTDRTWKIINQCASPKLQPIRHGRNLGKGAAVARAVKSSRGTILLLIDADLINFKPTHVDLLLSPLIINPKCMVIGLREQSRSLERTFGALMKPFGGERAFSRGLMTKILPRIERAGYGMEALLNLRQVHQGQPIYYMPLPGLIHRLKQDKHPVYIYAKEYMKENAQILKQYFDPENKALEAFFKQITAKLGI